MNKSFIVSFAYTNNLMFFTGLITLLTFFGYSSLAAEIGITYSVVATINLLFSYNLKSLILFDNNEKFALEVFNFRVYLGIITIVLTLLVFNNYNLNFYSNKLIFALVIIITQQWLLEIFLIINELKKKYKIIIFYNILSFVNIFLIILNISFLENKYLLDIFYFIILTNIFLILFFFNIKNFVSSKFFKVFNSISKLFALTSSISIILSIFIWRVFIYINYEKEIAGILFSSFAIGSFIGSFFATAIGPSMIRNKVEVKFYSKIYFYFIIFFLTIVYFFSYENFLNIQFTDNQLFLFKSTIYSIVGSSLMLFSVIFRLNYFYMFKNNRGIVYRYDIVNSLLISFIPVVLYFYDKNAIMFSYLFASVVSFIMYYSLNRLNSKLF